jgi:hypothetical protein
LSRPLLQLGVISDAARYLGRCRIGYRDLRYLSRSLLQLGVVSARVMPS